jgi:spermidine/putrescine transport system permease protein
LLSAFDPTLPVVIWSMLRTGLNPQTNAAGTLVFLLSLLAAAGFELTLMRRKNL